VDETLAIFAKAPVAGLVKTRLCPPLTPAQAAAFAAASLCDTAAKALGIVPCPALYYHGDRGVIEAALLGGSIAPDLLCWVSQGEGDLGARMARVPAPCVIVGSDSPSLPAAFVSDALAVIRSGRVALGPASDGGYYLIGLPGPLPELFAGVDWSTDRVLGQTLGKAERIGAPVVLLPQWYDVDTPADLLQLDRDLAAGCAECPRMRQLRAEIENGAPLDA
jgi:rSAM/selenodomain-associated transferase 1